MADRAASGPCCTARTRSGENGFTSFRRSTEHGFTSGKRSAEHGFTSEKRSAEHGFTLLEMLVALAVFSLAALALVRLQAVSLRTTADLDNRAMAGIVAQNIAVEAMTDASAPARGQAQGVITNGGRNWRWSRLTAPTDDQRLVRIDVRVTAETGGSPALLTVVRPAT